MTQSFPALAFRSGVIPGNLIPAISFDTTSFTAAADGSVWTLADGALNTWDAQKGSWDAVGTVASPASIGPYVAAVSNGLVYVISTSGVVKWTTDGGVTSVAALPNGESASVIAAAPDGTVVVASSANHVYSLSSTGSWTQLPTPGGGTIVFLSAGNASFILAQIQPQGDIAYYVQYDGSEWSSSEAMGVVAFACPDGSLWASLGENLLLLPPNGPPQGFQVPDMLNPAAPLCAAPTTMGFYYVSGSLAVRGVAWGIADQPAVSWPAMTGTQQVGYDAISNEVGATGDGGIRDQYSNINAPFSDWYTDVKTMTCPSGVTAADWTVIQNQVLDELNDVVAVNAFFVSMAILATNVSAIQTDTYNEVVQMVGLPADPTKQPQTTIDIILGKIFDQMISSAISAAPAEVAKTLNAGVQILKFAADKIAQQNGATNCDQAMHLACAKLAAQLAAIITANSQTSGDLQTAILTDWGKLSGCGTAIKSGVWYWPPKFDYSVLSGIGDSTHTTFYQALMPAMWQISLLESFDSAPEYAPLYTLMSKSVRDGSGNVLAWWWVCEQQGADVSIWSKGPWPNQNLIEAINAVGSIQDFFTGANGWNLPVATMDGYLPPDPSIPFNPWVDNG